MQRKAMVIGIKPECIEEYKKYHSDPWPEVLECISEGNVKNFSIFIHDTILFGYFEYHGDNLEADMKKWGENKKMQEWWDIHIPMLEPLEKGKRDDGWIYMDEIFHSR